jgi:hypothetical protein
MGVRIRGLLTDCTEFVGLGTKVRLPVSINEGMGADCVFPRETGGLGGRILIDFKIFGYWKPGELHITFFVVTVHLEQILGIRARCRLR